MLTAGIGSEALTLLAQHRGELKAVITDPGQMFLDGRSNVEAIRRLDPEVAIITTRRSEGDRGEDRGVGVWATLQKPFEAAALLAAVDRVVRPA